MSTNSFRRRPIRTEDRGLHRALTAPQRVFRPPSEDPRLPVDTWQYFSRLVQPERRWTLTAEGSFLNKLHVPNSHVPSFSPDPLRIGRDHNTHTYLYSLRRCQTWSGSPQDSLTCPVWKEWKTQKTWREYFPVSLAVVLPSEFHTHLRTKPARPIWPQWRSEDGPWRSKMRFTHIGFFKESWTWFFFLLFFW